MLQVEQPQLRRAIRSPRERLGNFRTVCLSSVDCEWKSCATIGRSRSASWWVLVTLDCLDALSASYHHMKWTSRESRVSGKAWALPLKLCIRVFLIYAQVFWMQVRGLYIYYVSCQSTRTSPSILSRPSLRTSTLQSEIKRTENGILPPK